jgi:hypothetical protein
MTARANNTSSSTIKTLAACLMALALPYVFCANCNAYFLLQLFIKYGHEMQQDRKSLPRGIIALKHIIHM